ncbi:hypothetical protein V1525DRAFT_411120 [Lipomyces kononenkoae]|uniref:Uncharacterized protein n=1 Tax=Lipomyces kononenkoae TaxID=34357 RepID=A0ACC3STS7_LIPKO
MFFWMELAGVLFETFGEANLVPNEAYTWVVIGHPVASGFIQASMYLFVLSCLGVQYHGYILRR